MIVPSPALQLLSCPVCGGLAELHQADDGSESFVVFCSDSHCAGNQAPACSTAEEAAATWNKLAGQPYRWHKTCCPACGWCEADEKGFKEHLATLPKPSRWERLSRRINWDGILTDAYWMFCILFSLRVFDHALTLNGITSVFTLSFSLRFILIFATPLYVIRIAYSIISRRMLMREFDAVLSSSESTTTPPPTKENHHG